MTQTSTEETALAKIVAAPFPTLPANSLRCADLVVLNRDELVHARDILRSTEYFKAPSDKTWTASVEYVSHQLVETDQPGSKLAMCILARCQRMWLVGYRQRYKEVPDHKAMRVVIAEVNETFDGMLKRESMSGKSVAQQSAASSSLLLSSTSSSSAAAELADTPLTFPAVFQSRRLNQWCRIGFFVEHPTLAALQNIFAHIPKVLGQFSVALFRLLRYYLYTLPFSLGRKRTQIQSTIQHLRKTAATKQADYLAAESLTRFVGSGIREPLRALQVRLQELTKSLSQIENDLPNTYRVPAGADTLRAEQVMTDAVNVLRRRVSDVEKEIEEMNPSHVPALKLLSEWQASKKEEIRILYFEKWPAFLADETTLDLMQAEVKIREVEEPAKLLAISMPSGTDMVQQDNAILVTLAKDIKALKANADEMSLSSALQTVTAFEKNADVFEELQKKTRLHAKTYKETISFIDTKLDRSAIRRVMDMQRQCTALGEKMLQTYHRNLLSRTFFERHVALRLIASDVAKTKSVFTNSANTNTNASYQWSRVSELPAAGTRLLQLARAEWGRALVVLQAGANMALLEQTLSLFFTDNNTAASNAPPHTTMSQTEYQTFWKSIREDFQAARKARNRFFARTPTTLDQFRQEAAEAVAKMESQIWPAVEKLAQDVRQWSNAADAAMSAWYLKRTELLQENRNLRDGIAKTLKDASSVQARMVKFVKTTFSEHEQAMPKPLFVSQRWNDRKTMWMLRWNDLYAATSKLSEQIQALTSRTVDASLVKNVDVPTHTLQTKMQTMAAEASAIDLKTHALFQTAAELMAEMQQQVASSTALVPAAARVWYSVSGKRYATMMDMLFEASGQTMGAPFFEAQKQHQQQFFAKALQIVGLTALTYYVFLRGREYWQRRKVRKLLEFERSSEPRAMPFVVTFVDQQDQDRDQDLKVHDLKEEKQRQVETVNNLIRDTLHLPVAESELQRVEKGAINTYRFETPLSSTLVPLVSNVVLTSLKRHGWKARESNTTDVAVDPESGQSIPVAVHIEVEWKPQTKSWFLNLFV